MSLIYITGPSGSGKSTITNRLVSEGYQAYDADAELCKWVDNDTGEEVEYPRDTAARPPDWQSHHTFVMSEMLVAQLLESSHESPIIICGIAPNDLELAEKYFSKVICLSIDEQTMVDRVTTRQNNKYGQSPDQLAVIKKWYAPTMEKYSNYGATMIDGTLSQDEVLNGVIASIQG
jgi:adenylate kinase family enzyme